MGNRDNVDEMSSTSASVLLSILKLIDKYDLYGQVAYPKHHKQADVPDIYRLAARTKVKIVRTMYYQITMHTEMLTLKGIWGWVADGHFTEVSWEGGGGLNPLD